jgi:hypothetical protein
VHGVGLVIWERPVTREKLQEVRDWADRAIASPEMSVAWYELIQVRVSLDAVLGSPAIVAVFLREDSQKMTNGSCSHLRLVESNESEAAPRSD